MPGQWSKELALDAISLSTCLSWLALHRFLLNRGFVLRRKGLSTDARISWCIVGASTVWFSLCCRHALQLSMPSSGTQWWATFLSAMAKGPVLSFLVSCFWVLSWLDNLWANRNHRRPHLWSLTNVMGPFDWKSGFPDLYLSSMYLLTTVTVTATAAATLWQGDTVTGSLNIVGLGLFLANGVGNNPYDSALHRYTDDMLRVVLATSHHEGTVYVLPSRGQGLDAVWSPKIRDEHIMADGEIMRLFGDLRSGKFTFSEPLERLRTTLAAYQQRVLVSAEQLEYLAAWIYVDPSLPFNDSRELACARAPNTNLLGRELLFALCHAEYLIFMAQGRLSLNTQAQLGRLRSMKRSGAAPSIEGTADTIGYKTGIEGFKEATRHIYAILGEEVDPHVYQFDSVEPPRFSIALSTRPSSIEEYVANLWDLSCRHSESTFTAMYFFSLAWSMEMGNVGGFHIFPVRCHTRDGDLLSQELVWRQLWYMTLIVQLVVKSPLLFGLFAIGILR